MLRLHDLSRSQRERLLEKVLKLFLLFCRQEFKTVLYPYQIRVCRALLSSILVEPKDVYVKIARQSGKTEALTLLLRFLMIWHVHFLKRPLMAAIASPKGEQAKTDVDRIKKSIQQLRERWHLEDRENNQATIRAYRNDRLCCEMYRFSLAPTTDNESKTLNVLAIEESHKADHTKRRDQLDPMLASTAGVTWHFGVGCPVLSDFKRGCDGQMPDSVAIIVDAEEVCRDRRKVYERTGDPIHLAYETKFLSDLRKYGRQNPEIKRNYFLLDTVEEGNFISRERLTALGRRGDQYNRKNGILIPVRDLTLSLDWGRRSDWTWAGLTNLQFDLVDLWKFPHVRYEEQIGLLLEELKKPRKGWAVNEKGEEVEEEFTYFDRIGAVRGDSTGIGDFPMEYLRDHSGLPMDDSSSVQFTKQSKNEMYTLYEAALFRDAGDPLRYSYPADHPLAAEWEEQMTMLLRLYTGDGEFLSPRAPEEPGAHDDGPSMSALGAMGASQGKVGEILFA